MRTPILSLLSTLALALPAAAQGFEGSIVVRISGPGGMGAMTSEMTTKGTKVLNVIRLPGVGQEMRLITDYTAHTITTLRPFPPGMPLPEGVSEAKGVVAVSKTPETPKATGSAGDLRALGTSQVIAKTRCDDYEATSETGEVIRICLAKAISGRSPGVLGNAGGGGASSAWSKVLGGKPVMPLKVWTPNGQTEFEVVEIKPGKVSDRVFDVPSGYIDMATAMKNRTSTPKP